MQRYATSKLCNVLWSYALHRRFASIPDKQWTVVVFDPGMMPGTGLAREAGPVFRFFWRRVLPTLVPLLRRVLSFSVWTAQESGSNLAWVASETSTSGVYHDSRTQIQSSVSSYDEVKQEDLWKWTSKYITKILKEGQELVTDELL
ncbi:dehydrogenase reductase [Colletotrichum asianum]|uniref:Dehydrogenase reductase n=1 Tax=Colletotrichum asianum TaxID=702518 RepID=A0A8H3W9V8_9PEZI|nr:dehydrogenase reductase [Colletotrichum asianum]